MLHRVNSPKYAPLLMQVVVFEKNLLAWICTPPVTFTLDGLAAALGNDDQAKWLWERIYYQGQQTRFGGWVETAINYINRNPAIGPRILVCAQNDLDFHQHLTDAKFSFHERRSHINTITDADLKNFSAMLVGLYERIFGGAGFPATIHQDTTVGYLTRTKWNENFWESNPSLRFCPACNGQRPSKILNGRSTTANPPTYDENDRNDQQARASDIDHFFPKEKYPFLSVHPDNLIPTCLECNIKAHRSYDPLDDHTTETLLDTFHPYYCPAIDHIRLCIDVKTGPGIKVTIQELDGTRSKRINNLVRVFDLETRWAGWFTELIDSAIQSLRHFSPAAKTDLRDLLQADFDNNQYYRLARHQCFVYASLLQYVLNDPQEFDDLCSTLGF